MTATSISLPEELEEFVEAERARRGFATANEYICDLLREERRRLAKRQLEAKLVEGLQSAAHEMTEAEWAALRERMSERHPNLRK